MIKYALVCDHEHHFDSWFDNSGSFDVQLKRGQVVCPRCQSKGVDKAVMSPAVASLRGSAQDAQATPDAAALDDATAALQRSKLRVLRDRITQNAQDVGHCFPQEARKMHDGDIEARPIFGQASLQEARALLEEGIAIMPLPSFPDDRH